MWGRIAFPFLNSIRPFFGDNRLNTGERSLFCALALPTKKSGFLTFPLHTCHINLVTCFN